MPNKFRRNIPTETLIICGDNDAFTIKADGTPWNPGREKAVAVAWKYNAKVILPSFHDTSTKPTDFNDLMVLEGCEAVRKQISMAKHAPQFFLDECEENKGAPFRDEHLKGLNELKARDLPAFRVLRHELKKLHVGVGALDDAMMAKGNGGGTKEDSDNPEESAAAEIIAEQMINVYAFDKKSEKWIKYTEGYWSDTQKQDIKESVSKIMRDSTFFPSPYKNYYFNGIVQLLRNHLSSTPKEEDRHLLPFKNGVLDINTKTLMPNDPEYGFTWQLPYKYDPSAKCKPITKWLQKDGR